MPPLPAPGGRHRCAGCRRRQPGPHTAAAGRRGHTQRALLRGAGRVWMCLPDKPLSAQLTCKSLGYTLVEVCCCCVSARFQADWPCPTSSTNIAQSRTELEPPPSFPQEDTILTAAVDGGNPALVATLLSAGADPNQTNMVRGRRGGTSWGINLAVRESWACGHLTAHDGWVFRRSSRRSA